MTLARSAYYAAGAAYAHLAGRGELGTSIYDDEWDVCIILDSARADMFEALVDDHLDFDSLSRRTSLGSVTTEWLASTFRESRRDAIVDTSLVTAHPHTATVFDEREWLTTPEKSPVSYPSVPAVKPEAFANVYRLYEHATGAHGVVTPDAMADATIAAHRANTGRTVAHWLQPHEPFIAPAAQVRGGAALEGNVWEGLQAGDLDPAAVWQSYRANLAHALRSVAHVTRAIDARVLITADHGNLWDVAGLYGHPFAMPHPQVRRVPWCLTQATRRITYEPEVDLTACANTDTTDQLAALGYA